MPVKWAVLDRGADGAGRAAGPVADRGRAAIPWLTVAGRGPKAWTVVTLDATIITSAQERERKKGAAATSRAQSASAR